jgi:hypothetical protein
MRVEYDEEANFYRRVPMPKGKAKKKAARKPARKKVQKKKTVKKKVIRGKAPGKKSAGKKAARKKITKKKTKKKAALKKRPVRKTSIPQKVVTIEPGPPPAGIPPVEEPAANEEAVGTVTHYYSHLGVAVIQVNKGVLKTGDAIRIKGHTSDFTQQAESMEYEHRHVDEASAGQSVGLKVKDQAREHDIVYIVK